MEETSSLRDRLRSSTKGLSVASSEPEAKTAEARIPRLGHRPTARRSMLELPEELPLSAGTVNFMSFAMVCDVSASHPELTLPCFNSISFF